MQCKVVVSQVDVIKVNVSLFDVIRVDVKTTRAFFSLVLHFAFLSPLFPSLFLRKIATAFATA